MTPTAPAPNWDGPVSFCKKSCTNNHLKRNDNANRSGLGDELMLHGRPARQ